MKRACAHHTIPVRLRLGFSPFLPRRLALLLFRTAFPVMPMVAFRRETQVRIAFFAQSEVAHPGQGVLEELKRAQRGDYVESVRLFG